MQGVEHILAGHCDQLLSIWAQQFEPKARIIHKRGTSPLAWRAFCDADVDNRALPVVFLQREGRNGDGRERDLVLMPLREGLKLLVRWAAAQRMTQLMATSHGLPTPPRKGLIQERV